MSAIDHKGRSITDQIGGVFGGLPAGVAHLTKSAATDLAGLVRVPVDIAKGDLSPSKLWGQGNDMSTMHKYFPTITSVVESGEDTAGRLAQLSPVETRSVGGRPVETYGDAWRHGNIVSAALNDVGNLAVVGGAAGKALGAGARGAEALGATQTASRLGQAADVAASASRLGGKIANAPMTAGTSVLKGGRSLLRAGGQAAKNAILEAAPKEGWIATRFATSLTPEGRLLKQGVKASRAEPSIIRGWANKNLARDSGLVDKRGRLGKDAPSVAEQEAALTLMAGVGHADKMVADQIGADKSLAAHVDRGMLQPGETMTPEGQAVAHAYIDGTLDPAARARIDKVQAGAGKLLDFTGKRADEGRGMVNGPLDPAYHGDEMIPSLVQRKLEDAGMSPVDAEALVAMHDPTPGSGAEWNDLAALAPELHDIMLNPDAYPTPWREAMNVTERGTAHGAVGLPRTPQEFLAAGMERPRYMPSAPSRLADLEGPKTTPTTEGFNGGVRGVGSEKHRGTLGSGPYSLATLADAVGKGIGTTEYNHILTKYMTDSALPTVRSILGDTKVAELRQEASDNIDAMNIGNAAKKDLSLEKQKLFGNLVAQELHINGREVLTGDHLNPQPKDFDVGAKKIDPLKIDEDSLALPTGLKDRLVQHRTGADTNMLLSATGKTNEWAKRQVLPFNLHWTPGDMISNELMSWVAGGISPIKLLKAMRQEKGLGPVAKEQLFDRPNFVDSGLRHQSVQALDPTMVPRKAPRTPWGKAARAGQNKGFEINARANAWQRHQYVLAKTEKILEANGLDSVAKLGEDQAKWERPEVQKAVNDAVLDANKTLGTMDEMTPFESRVLKQAFWFWPWTRHITTLALRTAVDNPARVLWTLRLGALGMNTSPDDMPDFMRGSLGTPWGRINLNWANPMYDVGSGSLASPGAATRSLSPILKVGLTAALNRDPTRDLNTITHRSKTDPSRFASAFYQALNTSPFIRGAMNLAPTMEVPGIGLGLGPHRRYGSGQTILSPGTDNPADTTPRWRAAANMLNSPLPQSYVPTTPPAPKAKKRKTGLGNAGLGSGLKHSGLAG